jgi:outer membrane receptor protein involved in Fe transport
MATRLSRSHAAPASKFIPSDRRRSVILLALSAFAYCGLSPAPVQAAVLEEIIVTAQKREESMQDVPIAIQAVLGADLRSDGIEKLENLAPLVPSLHVSEAFGGDQIFLRGLGPGVNFGFEQAVGQVVDGFFYGRSRFSRLHFLDLERVEVLKGPQGAILGKNTTAGAINITTAKPTREFEAWVTAGYEVEGAEGYAIEGAVSGPLVNDTVSGRLAIRYENKDGFLDNQATGNEDQSRDDIVTRASVLIEPSDRFNALLQYSYADIDRPGRNIQVTICSPSLLAAIASLGLPEDCELNDTRSVLDERNGVPGFEGQQTEASTAGLTLNWEFDNFTLTSLTGYAEYDYVDQGNSTYTAIENLMVDILEDYQQISQEIRITSTSGGKYDYIAGVFYLDHELDSVLGLHIRQAGPAVVNRNRLTQTFQDGDTLGAFGQFTWHLSDQWDLTLEGRYTEEDKTARSIQYPTEIYTLGGPVPGPGTGGPLGVFNVHDVTASRSESDFSPGAIVQWRPGEGSMLYASVRRGFKGGGFDHQLTANQLQATDGRFDFEEEEVLAYEIGAKFDLMEKTARLNLSAFRNEYDNLQVSSIIGPATFAVGNAAAATTQGLEADFQWRPMEALTLGAVVAYLDAEYDEYVGECNVFQVDNGLCTGGSQDLSGETLQFAPDYSYSFSGEYVFSVGNGLELITMVRAYGQDDSQLATDNDPNNIQDGYTKWDAKVALANSNGRWDISLIGRNLGDKTTISFGNDVNPFRGSYWGMTEPPRTVILQGTLRF